VCVCVCVCVCKKHRVLKIENRIQLKLLDYSENTITQ